MMDTPKLKRRWLQCSLWAFFVLMLMAGMLALWQWSRATNALPEPKNIERMNVVEWYDDADDDNGKPYPGFDVPQKYWGELFGNLSPHNADKHPAKWVVMAVIEIDTPTQHYTLWLFEVENPIAAFKVWSNRGDSERGSYFRGGNYVQARETLEKAYIEAEKLNGRIVVPFLKKRTKAVLLAKFQSLADHSSGMAHFSSRNEAHAKLGKPDGIYAPHEQWEYRCVDGRVLFSVGEGWEVK